LSLVGAEISLWSFCGLFWQTEFQILKKPKYKVVGLVYTVTIRKIKMRLLENIRSYLVTIEQKGLAAAGCSKHRRWEEDLPNISERANEKKEIRANKVSNA